MPPQLPKADLDAILAATGPLWAEMRQQRVFLTGGTGFFGCWLVESFLHANRAFALGAQLTVLTRDPAAFRRKLPHLAAEPALKLLKGDVRSFAFPAEPHVFIIHAATEASARLLAENPEAMRSTILAGTQRVLQFAQAADTRKLLFTSSGAIYGPQPPDLRQIPEDLPPQPGANVYGQAKLFAEELCAASASPTLEIKLARCFAFLGPHLPLDTHFAAGNFLADALAGRTIHIAGDGSTIRSYLYAADLAIWLWTMLFRAASLRPCNVGSEHAFSMRQLAQATVAAVNPASAIEVAQTPDPTRAPDRYVPSTARAREELRLYQSVPLDEALRRTARWHQIK